MFSGCLYPSLCPSQQSQYDLCHYKVMFVPPGTGGGAGDNLIYSSLLQHLNASVVNEEISD